MRLTRFSAVAATVVAFAVAPALAASGGPVKGARYSGMSGPGYPLSFKVSANGKAVDDLVVASLDTCHPGAGNVAPKFHFPTLAVNHGKFAGTSTDRFGKTVTDKLTIKGTFSGRDATGTVSDFAKVKSLKNCTQSESFTARAK